MPIDYSLVQFGQVSKEPCPLEENGFFLRDPFGTKMLFILGQPFGTQRLFHWKSLQASHGFSFEGAFLFQIFYKFSIVMSLSVPKSSQKANFVSQGQSVLKGFKKANFVYQGQVKNQGIEKNFWKLFNWNETFGTKRLS